MKIKKFYRMLLGEKPSVVEVKPESRDIDVAESVPEQGGVFEIHTPEELAWVAKVVNEGTCDFDEKIVKLANDICLDGYRWIPIGKGFSHGFRGVFDGNGRTISGVYIDIPWNYAGFFGFVAGVDKIRKAEVRDLNLLNIKIENRSREGWVGGLIGRAQEGVIIDKCKVQGTILSDNCAGGMIGYAEDCVLLRNCSAEISFSVKEEAAGLVCCLTEHSVITDCTAITETVCGVRPEELVYDVRNNSMVRR